MTTTNRSGRRPQWAGKTLTKEMVEEFADRMSTLAAEETAPARGAKTDLTVELVGRGFPMKPLSMALQIRDISRDENVRAEFVRQLNFALDALGIAELDQGDIFEGATLEVVMPAAVASA